MLRKETNLIGIRGIETRALPRMGAALEVASRLRETSHLGAGSIPEASYNPPQDIE